MRNPLSPAPIPTGSEYLWGLMGFVVALALLAGIAAVAERGASNWQNVRASHAEV